MIVDTLTNAERYYSLHPRFREAFEFLKTQPLATMSAEKYILDGDSLIAAIQDVQGKGAAQAAVEYHRKYIDIQYVVSGCEEIGWIPVEGIGKPGAFDAAKDFALAADAPLCFVTLRPGSFAVFFPEDGHAPCIGTGTWRKVVVKVLL